jgi:hypothetical protein
VGCVGDHVPGPRTAVGAATASANLVPALVNSVPVRTLVDNGASSNGFDGRIYRKILRVVKKKSKMLRLGSANAAPCPYTLTSMLN